MKVIIINLCVFESLTHLKGILSVMDILIMESDRAFNGQLVKALKQQGNEATCVEKIEAGLNLALSEPFDFILIGSAELNAGDIFQLKQIPLNQETPVMVLSDNQSVDKRIDAFKHGADDFLIKPVNLSELFVRMDVILRRYQGTHPKASSVLSAGKLTLHKASQSIAYADYELNITPIQFRLLWQLVQNRHQVLSKPFLYQTVLGRSFSPDDRSLDMHLSRIRKKLISKGMSPGRLTTVHGKGYRFS